jgi:hypothetical protein
MPRFRAAPLTARRPTGHRAHTVPPPAGATRPVAQEGVIDTLLRVDLDFVKKSPDLRTA